MIPICSHGYADNQFIHSGNTDMSAKFFFFQENICKKTTMGFVLDTTVCHCFQEDIKTSATLSASSQCINCSALAMSPAKAVLSGWMLLKWPRFWKINFHSRTALLSWIQVHISFRGSLFWAKRKSKLIIYCPPYAKTGLLLLKHHKYWYLDISAGIKYQGIQKCSH